MVDSIVDGLSQEKLSTSASGGQNLESPIAYWVRAAAMTAAKNKLAELELGSKQQLPEDFSARDFDVVRARALSSQI
jgi:hypothetical protein